jgi:hypothetical protein
MSSRIMNFFRSFDKTFLSFIILVTINNLNTIILHNAIEKKNEKYVVTKYGELMIDLPTSLRASHFITHVLYNISSEYWYYAVVLAAWIDYSNSLFYRPVRKFNQSVDDYNELFKPIKEKQKTYYKEDCVKTMYNIWIKSLTFNKTQYCQNGIYEKSINDIESSVRAIIRCLRNKNFNIKKPTLNEMNNANSNIEIITNAFENALLVAFPEMLFELNDHNQ